MNVLPNPNDRKPYLKKAERRRSILLTSEVLFAEFDIYEWIVLLDRFSGSAESL